MGYAYEHLAISTVNKVSKGSGRSPCGIVIEFSGHCLFSQKVVYKVSSASVVICLSYI